MHSAFSIDAQGPRYTEERIERGNREENNGETTGEREQRSSLVVGEGHGTVYRPSRTSSTREVKTDRYSGNLDPSGGGKS